MLTAYAPVPNTDTRVLGAKLKHCLNHDKPQQGNKGEQGRNKEQIHHDSAYYLLSIGDPRIGLRQKHTAEPFRTLRNSPSALRQFTSSLCYDYCVEGKRFKETRPLNPLQKPTEVPNADRLLHH